MPGTGDPIAANGAIDLDPSRYRALFEALPDGILILDDDGRCLDANLTLAHLLGRSRQQLIGAHLRELVPPERADAVSRAFDRLKSSGTGGGELALAPADGQPLELEWSARGSFAPGLHLIAAHDVRARSRAERRLSAEHAVTRLLGEAVDLEDAAPGILEALCDILGSRLGALWRLDPGTDRLRCVAVSSSPDGTTALADFEAASRGIAFARNEGLPGRVWAERTAAVIEELSADDNFLRQAVAARAGLTSGFGFPISIAGEFFGAIEFFADRSFAPDEPLLLMMTAIGHDIAQFVRHRQAEAEVRRLHRDLARKTEEHETIFNTVPALIWYKDDRNNIVRINRLAAQWVGLPPSQIEGRSTYDLYPDEAESYYQDDLEVIRSGQPKVGIVEPVAGPGGEKRWVRTDKIPYRNPEGKAAGVIVFAIDMTEQVQKGERPARDPGD
jgi:PAS domain S-box-containing protein